MQFACGNALKSCEENDENANVAVDKGFASDIDTRGAIRAAVATRP
jgi:hypothetical protein